VSSRSQQSVGIIQVLSWPPGTPQSMTQAPVVGEPTRPWRWIRRPQPAAMGQGPSGLKRHQPFASRPRPLSKGRAAGHNEGQRRNSKTVPALARQAVEAGPNSEARRLETIQGGPFLLKLPGHSFRQGMGA